MDTNTTLILSIFVSVVGVAIYEVIKSYYSKRREKK
jgi:hypothetical protein